MKDNIVIYVSKDGKIKVNTSIENDNIWMTQQSIAELFDTTKNNYDKEKMEKVVKRNLKLGGMICKLER